MRVVTAKSVRLAVQETLQEWFPYTLRQVAEAEGFDPDVVEQPKNWRRLPDLEALQDDQFPVIAVTSPGLIGQPTRDEHGLYRAVWSVVVSCIIRSNSFEDVADLVGLYTGAVRAALAQHPTCGGLASGVDWLDEEYGVLSSTAARTMGGGAVEFGVTVSDALDDLAAPLVAPEDPSDPDDEPIAETIELLSHPAL